MTTMRRHLARLVVTAALGLGCARTPPPISPLESAPLTPAPKAASPPFTVREVPLPVFRDPQRQAKIAALLPEVREVVARIFAADALVGLAVGIVVDGELVFGEGFGTRHTGQGDPIDIRTAFRIGSITKVFTAMTALQLHERGRLDLDGPAAAVLPELNTLVYPNADARPLSVRDILTHTGGLPLVLDHPGGTHTRDAIMAAIDGISLVRPPGLTYEYSNLGFALLGHIVAAASGKPYHDAIHEAILGPLGMKRTVWEPTEVPPPQFAIGHAVVNGRVVVVAPTVHGANDAAGGLLSTVEDLARFLAFQLAAWPARPDADDAPLTRSTLREAQRLRALRRFRARTTPADLADGGVEGGASGVGLAWSVSHSCEHPYVVGHNGAVNGYHSTVNMLPAAGIGIIVLGNASWTNSGHIAGEIQSVLARGGVLASRAPQAVPALTEAAERIIGNFGQWGAAAFAGWSIQQLGQGSAGKRLAAHMQWLHEGLGACTLGPLKRATSPWSGVFSAECERGKAELTLTLTSARTPKVSSISIGWLEGTPTQEVQDAAAAATALLATFDEVRFREVFSTAFNRTTMDRTVAMMRFERGVCNLGRVLEVRGPREATYALDCDKGPGKLSLILDQGQPARIVSFQVAATGALPPCR